MSKALHGKLRFDSASNNLQDMILSSSAYVPYHPSFPRLLILIYAVMKKLLCADNRIIYHIFHLESIIIYFIRLKSHNRYNNQI